MPTYGYRCPACGHEYDRFQKMNDATRASCPACSAEGERLISGGAGIVFKGSGFYETDYKRAGEKKPSTDGPKDDAAKAKPPKDASTPAPSSSPAKPKSSGDAS